MNATPAKPPEWIMIANASRARCFERDAETHRLRELVDFVHEQGRLKATHLRDDRPGHAFKGTASTQFDARTEVHEKERLQFAQELAAWLEEAVLGHRYSRLVLMASPHFLGDLRSRLHDNSRHVLAASLALDLTTATGRDLDRHVDEALRAA